MKKYKRKGVGREISQWTDNLPARNFWDKVIAEYTNGKYNTFAAAVAHETGFALYCLREILYLKRGKTHESIWRK